MHANIYTGIHLHKHTRIHRHILKYTQTYTQAYTYMHISWGALVVTWLLSSGQTVKELFAAN